jgi:type IV pilus assembly protein PilX
VKLTSAKAPQLPVAQQGAVLIVAMIFVLLMTIVGLSAIRGSGMQEAMAGNMRHLQLNFQAAEAGLRVGESRVDVKIIDANLPPFDGSAGAYADLNQPGRTPVIQWLEADWNNAEKIAVAELKMPDSPSHVVESVVIPVGLESIAMGHAIDHASLDNLEEGRVYRITSRYHDDTSGGDVILQSLYKR